MWNAHRYGTIMLPEPGNEYEVEGTLNPAGVVGPDGEFYLFPRLVAAGNYSRIGVARVTRHPDGRPAGVKRVGVALAPGNTMDWRGVEDPRVCQLQGTNHYAMIYTAVGMDGVPRVALATSGDLIYWVKSGLVTFAEEDSYPGLNDLPNKDGILFPRPVLSPSGVESWALLHRPMPTDGRPLGIWISYLSLDLAAAGDPRFREHTLLANPAHAWDAYRIGGGVLHHTPTAWLLIYHGVELLADKTRRYCGAAMTLDLESPHRILTRDPAPFLIPRTRAELSGVVDNVVFPTAVHARGGDIDLYYGMADEKIGCVRLERVTSDRPTPQPARTRRPAPRRGPGDQRR